VAKETTQQRGPMFRRNSSTKKGWGPPAESTRPKAVTQEFWRGESKGVTNPIGSLKKKRTKSKTEKRENPETLMGHIGPQQTQKPWVSGVKKQERASNGWVHPSLKKATQKPEFKSLPRCTFLGVKGKATLGAHQKLNQTCNVLILGGVSRQKVAMVRG